LDYDFTQALSEGRAMTPEPGASKYARKAVGILTTALGVVLMVISCLFFWGGPRFAPHGEGVWIVYVTMAVIFIVAVELYRLGRRLRTLSGHDIVANDPRAPVLYLRSFSADSKVARHLQDSSIPTQGVATEEEQLTMAVQCLGPLRTIGRPGELLPLLGAGRIYVSENKWKEEVRELIRKSALILLRIGSTEGFWWEVATCAREANPERVVFLVPKKQKLYEEFRQRAAGIFPHRLPDFPKAGVFSEAKGSIAAILRFERDWTPSIAPVRSRLLTLGHPVGVELAEALGPLLHRAGGDCYKLAPIASSCKAALIDVLVLFLLSVVAYFVALIFEPKDPKLVVILFLGIPVLAVPYFFGFEMSVWRASPGKRYMGLQVLDRTGIPMSWFQAICRTLVTVGLWPYSLSRLVGLRPPYDQLSQSVVVRRRDLVIKERLFDGQNAVVGGERAAVVLDVLRRAVATEKRTLDGRQGETVRYGPEPPDKTVQPEKRQQAKGTGNTVETPVSEAHAALMAALAAKEQLRQEASRKLRAQRDQ
jgi:uncharacterized RDD family membrane protein YckC